MNFMGKSSGGGGNSGSRQQQPEEEEEEERQNTGPTGRLFPSSSSSSPSSSHLHHHQQQHQNQQPQFHNQQPYNPPGGWMFDGSTLAEPSSRPSEPEPMASTNDDEPQQQGMMMVVEREHMFDKVVTPSDVGKLNRLVIPKQHAERYFPLDSSTNDKGLLLNFEDRNGKPWRFRYSYWNSSQSYVMTKGWSRFVKDKKLDAGDIVSFQRGVGGLAKDRLFIDWRHRPDAGPNPAYHHHHRLPLQHHQFSFHNRNVNNLHPWNPVFLQSQAVGSRSQSGLMVQPYGAPSGPYGTGSVVNMNPSGSGSVIYFRPAGQQQHQLDMMGMQHRSGVGMGMGMGIGIDPHTLPPAPAPAAVGGQPGMVFESVPVVHGKAAAKRLRLFGVNMDCPIPDDDDDQDYDPTSQLSPTMVPSSTSINPIHMRNYYLHNHPPTLSSSSSTIPYVQLRPYEQDYEPQFRQNTVISSSSTDAFNKNNKSSSSSHMSLDLDI